LYILQVLISMTRCSLRNLTSWLLNELTRWRSKHQLASSWRQ